MAHSHVLASRWLLIALLGGSGPATALEVSPLRVSIPARAMQAEVWLYNPEPRPWSGQARLYRWEQTEDSEVLVPAEDVALSPAELHIAPNTRQRMRVVRLAPPPEAVERGYRLVIQAHEASPPLRVSLPVFLAPATPIRDRPALGAFVETAAAGPVLRLYNAGSDHARLTDLVFIDAAGARHRVVAGLAGYVLPRQTRRWPLPGRPEAYAGGEFRARLEDGEEVVLGGMPPTIAPPAQAGL